MLLLAWHKFWMKIISESRTSTLLHLPIRSRSRWWIGVRSRGIFIRLWGRLWALCRHDLPNNKDAVEIYDTFLHPFLIPLRSRNSSQIMSDTWCGRNWNLSMSESLSWLHEPLFECRDMNLCTCTDNLQSVRFPEGLIPQDKISISWKDKSECTGWHLIQRLRCTQIHHCPM